MIQWIKHKAFDWWVRFGIYAFRYSEVVVHTIHGDVVISITFSTCKRFANEVKKIKV